MAFLACILSVYNAGAAVGLEKQVAQMNEKLEGLPRGTTERVSTQLDRIGQSLDRIGGELRALEEFQPSDAPEELRAKLRELQQILKETREGLADFRRERP